MFAFLEGGKSWAWTSPQFIGLVMLSAGLLATLIFVEGRAPEPLIPLRLFRHRTYHEEEGHKSDPHDRCRTSFRRLTMTRYLLYYLHRIIGRKMVVLDMANAIERIITLTDLQKHTSELVNQVRQSGEPIIVTQRGRPAALVISAERYTELVTRLERLENQELLQSIDIAEAEFRSGGGIPHDEAVKGLRKTWAKR